MEYLSSLDHHQLVQRSPIDLFDEPGQQAGRQDTEKEAELRPPDLKDVPKKGEKRGVGQIDHGAEISGRPAQYWYN